MDATPPLPYIQLKTALGASAGVTIIVKPIEGAVPYLPQGKTITNTVHVKANETDTNLVNDTITENTTAVSFNSNGWVLLIVAINF